MSNYMPCNDAKHLPLVVVVPHWQMEGGAGFYTEDLILGMAKIADVRVGGVYAGSYGGSIISSDVIDRMGKFSFPIYDGVRLSSSLFHIAFSLLRLLTFAYRFYLPQRQPKIQAPDIIILTSSVQALAVPLVRWVFKKCKVIIVVQENVKLFGLLGWIMRAFLHASDGVISITDSWSAHARTAGIKTSLLRNGYNSSYSRSISDPPPIKSDILYVGGSSAIKGFTVFLSALPFFLSDRSIRIVCLGKYEGAELKALEYEKDKRHPSGVLDIVGLVADIRPYLRGTKLLVLPIGNAHFCRPAIEAGFFGKTFVISRLDGLEDFVFDGTNCLAFEAGSVADFVAKTQLLLKDIELRERLEAGNRRNSVKFQRSEDEIEKTMRAILPDVFVRMGTC